ncbi:MAG TPA: MFS transporter [Rhizomicrobium sp.]
MTADAIFRKAAWRLLPFMFLCFVVSFLDRVNVGFAALTMNHDLGFSYEVYSLGAGIFFLGYFLFEIPSNLILERVGARRWMSRIMLTWGLVSMMTMFARGPVSFYALRFLLGLAEAGFYPGMILYLTYWFPGSTRARYIAYFFAAVPFANMIGGPISTQVLGMNGIWHLHGWQWLFLLEGIPSLILGVAILFLLPDRPASAAWLNAEEKKIVQDRLAQEPVGEVHGFFEMLRDPRVWMLIVPALGIVIALYGINYWLPLMLKGMGFSISQIGPLTTLPYICALIAMVLLSFSSDRRGERVWHTCGAAFIGSGGMLAAALLHGVVPQIAAICVAVGGLYAAFTILWTFPAALLRGTAAAGGFALINSFANLGGFFGPNIMGWLRQHTGGYSAGLSVLALALIVACVFLFVVGRSLDSRRAS